MANTSEKIVADLFRTEYGKLVALLTRFFGAAHIQLAEDIVQETLISALDHWSVDSIPENPAAWLVQVAKRKALNELKRNKMKWAHHESMAFSQHSFHEPETLFLSDEIEDSQLRMIFTCCHPSLNISAQIALTLKTLCGFGVKEVARALLTTESTINKRLYRAKTRIRDSKLPFLIPQGEALEKRLDTVSLTLYLLFNEGYNSSVGDSLIQKELCLEAIRLTKLLLSRFPENRKLCALLALMCFHTARFEARIDKQGAIILFEDQDRSKWNPELIQLGMFYFKKSIHDKSLSAYHIEASIAAEHCLAQSFETTNWQRLYQQYELLQKLKPNPVIRLNLAIIASKIEGIEKSLEMLEELSQEPLLKNYHLLPATQGVFNLKLKNYKRALSFFERALLAKPSSAERSFIQEKMDLCKKNLPRS